MYQPKGVLLKGKIHLWTKRMSQTLIKHNNKQILTLFKKAIFAIKEK